MCPDDGKKAVEKAKDAGSRALRRTKDVLDSASAKKLRDRVEEYADLSSTVLAAHEDRLVLIEDRLTAMERREGHGGYQVLLWLAAIALLFAAIALVMVLMA